MKTVVKTNNDVHIKKEKKRKLPTWGKGLIILISILVIIIASIFVFINMKLNMINQPKVFETIPPEAEYFEPDTEAMTTSFEDEITEIDNTSDIVWSTEGSVIKDKDITNILLIGQDRRPGESRARSDSMIIATINKKNNTIKITSLMRDLYVQIPGYSDNRINAAYAFGGMELINATIEKNFQIHIDGNIEVDFNGFEQVINKIGGIDITINSAEAAYLTEEEGFTGLSEGKVHMDGALALGYSRIRYIGNSDYERTERQRRVLTTAFNNIKDLGLTKILGLANEIFPFVTTDLSNGQIISFATSFVMMGIDEIGTYRIPVDGGYTPRRIKGMSVLVPDLKVNSIALKEIIYGK